MNLRDAFVSLIVVLLVVIPAARAEDRSTVFYVGPNANTVFHDVMTLPDGSLLIAGGSDGLAWVPDGVPRIKLQAQIAGGPGGTRVAFVLHAQADLQRLLHVAAFDPGVAEDVRRLRRTGVPGKGPTGDLYLSVTTAESRANTSGYAIVKLDGNFVNTVPTRTLWARDVWAGRSHRDLQPWDVGSDGKVVYANGVDYAPDWASIGRLTADGKDDVVEHWRYHSGTAADGAKVDGHWTPASSRAGVKVESSNVIFKVSRHDLRSWTAEEYASVEPDGNGKTRQGHWPNDYYFAGPINPDDPNSAPKGRGYTGYSPGRGATHRIGAVVIDRRDNSIYVGYSVQSRLPSGEPDFEPAVIVWNSDGKLRWWSRLYHETPQNSTPDQYIDALAIDHANDRLIVGARAHGNNVINFWDGTGGFKNKLNGKTGNIHISWLGALKLKDGAFVNSAWLSELADATKGLGKPLATGPMAGWPDPNSGWADMNTTRLRGLAVDPATGRVLVLAIGRRPYTSNNAYQQMHKPADAASVWSDFVRVYEPLFASVPYSSIVNMDIANPATAKHSIDLNGMAPAADGALVVVGRQTPDGAGPAPLKRVPTWGASDATGAAIIGLLDTAAK